MPRRCPRKTIWQSNRNHALILHLVSCFQFNFIFIILINIYCLKMYTYLSDDIIAITRATKSQFHQDSSKKGKFLFLLFVCHVLIFILTSAPSRYRKKGNKTKRSHDKINSQITFGLYTKSALHRQKSTLFRDRNNNMNRASSVNDLSIQIENAYSSDDEDDASIIPIKSHLNSRINKSGQR